MGSQSREPMSQERNHARTPVMASAPDVISTSGRTVRPDTVKHSSGQANHYYSYEFPAARLTAEWSDHGLTSIGGLNDMISQTKWKLA
jgi:hypothetical protein